MEVTDSVLLEHLQEALTSCVLQNRGDLISPGVLTISRELDKLILKFMHQGG